MKKNFFDKIDYALLREQKLVLLEMLAKNRAAGILGFKRESEAMRGILHLIDGIQDMAVDELGISENTVFGKELENGE